MVYTQGAIIRIFANIPEYDGKMVEPPKRNAKLEWQTRWMVVRGNSLILYKDREVCLLSSCPLLSVRV